MQEAIGYEHEELVSADNHIRKEKIPAYSILSQHVFARRYDKGIDF
jgi:hypothetical protein